MTTHVVLIRGINVGSSKRVRMADLRDRLEADGFESVRTYLASGNVVLESASPAAEVGAAVESALEALGTPARALVRSAEQIAAVVAGNPYPDVDDGKKLHVAFLEGEPQLPEGDFAPEAFALRGQELYISLPEGMRDSRLMKALSRPQAGVTSTVRNWNTVAALHELTA